MPASPTRTPIRAARSTARATLRGNLERLYKAHEAAAAARQPLDRARDQVEHAQAMVRNAEAALASIDAQESALIGKSWPPPILPAKLKNDRREAEEALAVWRRTLTTVQRNAEVARVPAEQAAATVVEIQKEIDTAIMAVVAEEGDIAFARLVVARLQAVEAEAAVRSIAAVMVGRGWLRPAEQINLALYETPRPESSVNTAPYVSFVERLASDADAEV